MVGKNNFTLESIILYNPQRDKDLSASKEKVRNSGIGSQPNPQKNYHKFKQLKLEIKVDFGKNIFSKVISISVLVNIW